MRSKSPGRPADTGITLVELMVVTILVVVVGSLGFTAFARYASDQQTLGTANELVSDLRAAQQRAQSEGRRFCVRLEERAWTTYRGADCSTGTVVSRGETAGRNTVLVLDEVVGFTPNAGAYDVVFTPRGSATAGEVKVRRGAAGGLVRTIKVEGLTGRVAIN